MKAQSKDYIALQTLYRAKAQADLASVTSSVRSLESMLRKKTPIDGKEIEGFCKGAAFVKLVHGRRLQAITDTMGFGDRAVWAARELEDETSLLPIYIAVLALDAVVSSPRVETSGRDLPALLNTADLVEDMEDQVSVILERLQCEHSDLDLDTVRERILKFLKEIQRSGPVELHNISSLTGGIVAQEIIKIITKQYVPLDNTCVIDGIQSRTATFRL